MGQGGAGAKAEDKEDDDDIPDIGESNFEEVSKDAGDVEVD